MWQLRKRLLRTDHVLVAAYGLELVLPRSSGSLSNLHYFGEAFEFDLVQFARRYLRDGDVVVDGGANVGMFTYACVRAIGASGRVVAFEPVAEYGRYIPLNALLNRMEARVEYHSAALSDRQGTAEMTMDLDVSNHLSWVDRTPSVSRMARYVDLVTLDSLELEHVALLKLDLEGAELLALQGAVRTIREHRVDVIAIEAHDHSLRKMGHSASEVFEFLRSSGFQPFGLDRPAAELRRLPGSDTIWVAEFAADQVLRRCSTGLSGSIRP